MMKQHNESILFVLSSRIVKHFTFIACLAVMVVSFIACQTEDELPRMQVGDKIEFGAMVRNNMLVTRALDSVYITHSPFNMDFFIELCCDNEPSEDNHFGTYVVPSGFDGRLDAKQGTNALKWVDLVSPHTFYSWNVPWREDYKPKPRTKAGDSDNIGDLPVDTIQVQFHGSAGKTEYYEYINDAILENFVGAKTVPYTYNKHGKYVDMTFHHLVSKIVIKSFILIETDGSIQEDLRAKMTFINMPTQATFYPHPKAGVPEREAGDKTPKYDRPRVDKPWVQYPDEGLTYYIANEAIRDGDVFYVCPEIDFRTIDYQIKLVDVRGNYAGRDVYYGTFDNVLFEREPGTDYDNVDGEDYYTLHAGEEMALNIVLIPGIGPGLSIVISKWSTDESNDATYHPYQGVYSDAEVNDLINSFANQKSYNDDEAQALANMLFEMYGEEVYNEKTEKWEKVFRLYDNVASGSNIFPVPPGYILDGQGHTISLKTNSGTYGWGAYYNIGYCRNIYLTDPNGNNTIYIDSDGYVYIEDTTTGEFVKTTHQLTPLTGNNKGYDINAQTGEVKQTLYYNNNITN